MEHILQFAVNIDDKAIVEMVQAKAEKAIVRDIIDMVKPLILAKTGYCSSKISSDMENLITKFLEEHRDEIVSATADNLACRLARTKRGKAILDEYDKKE